MAGSKQKLQAELTRLRIAAGNAAVRSPAWTERDQRRRDRIRQIQAELRDAVIGETTAFTDANQDGLQPAIDELIKANY